MKPLEESTLRESRNGRVPLWKRCVLVESRRVTVEGVERMGEVVEWRIVRRLKTLGGGEERREGTIVS